MSIVGIIPARWASTRFPGKPLALIAGKPLIQHVWEQCSRAKKLDRIIIATDDIRIAQVAQGFRAEVSMTRADHPSGSDRLAEVAKKLVNAQAIINIQGDEPLIDPALIDRLARALSIRNAPEMVTAATIITDPLALDNPNVVKVVLAKNGDALYFSRSCIPYQRDPGAAPAVYRHQGIYGYQRNFLLRFVRWPQSALEKVEQLEQLRALENGARVRVLITQEEAQGVDCPEDVAVVERALKKQK